MKIDALGLTSDTATGACNVFIHMCIRIASIAEGHQPDIRRLHFQCTFNVYPTFVCYMVQLRIQLGSGGPALSLFDCDS